MASPRANAIAALINPVLPSLPEAPQEISGDPADYVVPQNVNAQLFSGEPVITLSNVNSAQVLQVVLNSSPNSGFGSNIQSGASSMATASGLWKFVANISMGSRAKSSSIYYKGNENILDAIVAARAWIVKYANLLGNGGGAGTTDTTPSAKSPYVNYIRITDGKLPKYGQLVESPSGNTDYCGLYGVATGDNNADFASTALSLRLFGLSTTPAAQGFANHAIYGPPDAVVVEGDQLNLDLLCGGFPYSQVVATYLNYIFTTGNNLGFAVQDPTEAKKRVTAFRFGPANPGDVPTWQMTVAAHGYTSGDRVSLTKVNNPFFRGRYTVNVVDATTLTMVNGPPGSLVPIPTTGQVQRYQLADGTRKVVFAQATNTGLQLVAPFGLKPAKRNPARPFSAVSFRKKARRPH